MCNKGRRQSPIDVLPDKLLFDPGLRNLHFDKHKVIKFLFLINKNLYLHNIIYNIIENSKNLNYFNFLMIL